MPAARRPYSSPLAAVLCGLAAAVALAGIGADAAPPAWSYGGRRGPEQWGKLDPSFRQCSSGQRQSPINIDHGVHNPRLEYMEFTYGAGSVELTNTGHWVQWNYGAPSRNMSMMMTNGVEYQLQHVTFKVPSEHEVRGMRFPMEIQFVHESTDSFNRSYRGEIAVVSVLVLEGDVSDVLDPLTKAVPLKPGQVSELGSKVRIHPQDLFPERHRYYHYRGSETSPPCRQGVSHHVFQEYITASPEQLNKFRAAFEYNSRPAQSLNGRKVEAYNGPNAPDYRHGPTKEVDVPGPMGPVGMKGRVGPRGPRGPRGDTGAPGAPGLHGTNGTVGARGVRGYPGPKGRVGPGGHKGDTGLTGPSGDPGPAGRDGRPGKDSARVVGPIGPRGPKGDDVVGKKGPAGGKGHKGYPGPEGPRGDTGPAGPAGPDAAASGIGPKGQMGEKGLRGADGPAGARGEAGKGGSVGPRGPIGPEGEAGVEGWRGPLKGGWKSNSLYAEVLAESFAAAALPDFSFPIFKDQCGTNKATCSDLCEKKGFVCKHSLHLYDHMKPFTDVGQLGLKSYVYATGCTGSFCGPNWCICGSQTRPGYKAPPKPTIRYTTNRSGPMSSDQQYLTTIKGKHAHYGDTFVASVAYPGIRNRYTFGQAWYNDHYVLSRTRFRFMPRETKEWRFRGAVEGGWGAVALVDGKFVVRRRGQYIRPTTNWNSAQIVNIPWTTLDKDKWHEIDFFGSSYYDERAFYQFDDGTGWKWVTTANLFNACK
jgi:carbonic anhydrase